MQRNFPSAIELTYQAISELKHFATRLPPHDRLIFTRFAELALSNRGALTNAVDFTPLEIVVLLVLLEEHKANQQRYDQLRAELDLLKQPQQADAGDL